MFHKFWNVRNSYLKLKINNIVCKWNIVKTTKNIYFYKTWKIYFVKKNIRRIENLVFLIQIGMKNIDDIWGFLNKESD